jgi:hypothetical protein
VLGARHLKAEKCARLSLNAVNRCIIAVNGEVLFLHDVDASVARPMMELKECAKVGLICLGAVRAAVRAGG